MKKHVLLLTSIAALISGCATPVANFETLSQTATRDAALADDSALELLQRSEALAVDAKQKKLSYFAPAHAETAQYWLDKSQALSAKGKPSSEVKSAAMTSIRTWEAGLQARENALKTLKPAFDHQQVLREIHANDYYPEDNRQLNERLTQLIRMLEADKQQEANKEQRNLLADMHDLEVRVVEFVQLQAIKDDLAKLKTENADELSPISWQTAQSALKQAQALIAKTPRATGAIAKATEGAKRAAAHARVIADLTQEILAAKDAEAEALALRMERWLYQISVALKHDDIRYLSMPEQAKRYAAAVEELQR